MSVPQPALPGAAPAEKPARTGHGHGRKGLAGAFRHAYDGLVNTVAHQRNMKLHLIAAVLVGLVGSGIRLGLAEKVTLIFCVLLIFFAEILNTALEALVDLHTEDFNDLARVTKDAAAAGVLVLAIGTVVIFAAVLVHNWGEIARSGLQIARQAATGVPLATMVALLVQDRPRSTRADDVIFGLGIALWMLLWVWSVSYVFTTLTGGLLFLAWRASRRAHAHTRTRAR